MRNDPIEDAGFTPNSEENPVYRWAGQPNQSTPAEKARRDMREITGQHAAALRKALDDAGFKMPDNA